MRKQGWIVVLILLTLLGCQTKEQPVHTLKEALKDHFFMGVAVNAWQTKGTDTAAHELITSHFNSLVAENCMKSERIQPREGEFNFDEADEFVAYAEANGMHIVGHTLVWHSQAPRWFFFDETGNLVSAEVLTERLKTHIHTLVGRYKGRVHGWDVVNEAINEDGSYRESLFYQILGEDYIRLAFQFAREADPDAQLYYNDYNTMKPEKREGIYQMVKKLQDEGYRVDAIGMQCHLIMNFPSIEETEAAIVRFSELGDVMVTEMDLTILPWPSERLSADISMNYAADPKYNPYPETLSDSASVAWNNRMMDFFNVFIKHSDKITRVTMWGLTDAHTWRNNWPIRGRKDYPLLFDRENQAKPVVESIIKAALNQQSTIH
ncbi:MAG: endo-1,4-beta-xylanase [Prolixibacteraceae bacterium]|nr:endo-1,4-beta-xylanase [Prolixibacteraceae bacterium]